MDNLQGIVELISKKNNAVCISGTWYTLGPLVKMNYVKKGECEYRVETGEQGGNPLVVYVRAVNAPGASQTQTPIQKGLEESNTHRMSALKFAGNVYMGTGQEEDAKRLAEEANNYLEKGLWIHTEKVGVGKPVQASAHKIGDSQQQQYDDAY